MLALMIFGEASRWQIKATRIPWDPPTDLARYLRAAMLRQLGTIHKLVAPDRSIGRNWSIPMLTDLLSRLPAGTTELYFHPGHHLFQADLPVLLDESVKIASTRLTLCSYEAMSRQ